MLRIVTFDLIMKLLITIIDWDEYPGDGKIPPPHIWDLSQPNTMTSLIVTFGNGVIGEMKAEGDSVEAIQLLRGIIAGPGACKKVTLQSEEKKRLWLYTDGYECYTQEGTPPGYIFVNPLPQTNKFVSS